MINKIILKDVASYKTNEAILETDKKINLIYGLNGTGKSTCSKFLQDINNPTYASCSINPNFDFEETEILVYNHKYIEDNFYNLPSQKGIFSLSKENKEAKEIIDTATIVISKLKEIKIKNNNEINDINKEFKKHKDDIIEKVWKIKQDYSGGDRILKFCLDGFMSSKEGLFTFLKNLPKPTLEIKEIKKIKEEAQLLNDIENSIENISTIPINFQEIENNHLLKKSIVSSGNSNFSQFIQSIKNSDWVQSGLQYISTDGSKCPFCQQPIDKDTLLKNIQNCFDETYKLNKEEISLLCSSYETLLTELKKYSKFNSEKLLIKLKERYDSIYDSLILTISQNLLLLKKKKEQPSEIISIKYTNSLMEELNNVITEANLLIDDFNKKIKERKKYLAKLKDDFWNNMRNQYDLVISNYIKVEKKYTIRIQTIKKNIEENNTNIQIQRNKIEEKQKDVINIQEAIDHINSGLINLGISDFSIEPYNDLYQIKRGSTVNDVFKSLSEGEKMIISFLYFIEECKGKKDKFEKTKKKIVVIDDPISSLSHIYIFNIGRLIHNEFLRSDNFEQIFVFTHSLYFFYELTDIKKERREENQKLFRIIKNKEGSCILNMKYEEIQNDYHSYWKIVKDENSPQALIANCMRNIIDYFFNFIEKKDYNNVFQKQELKDNKFQSFNRYMNRESHSIGQNIFDIKEFDYEVWKKAFKLVFEKTNYLEHYQRMMK